MPNYTESDLSEALRAVQNGTSLRKAAAMYGIPRVTLRNRKLGMSTRKAAHEPQQRLSIDQEHHLRDWILAQQALGLPPTHAQLYDFASRILVTSGDLQPLGKSWVSNFMRRNPEIKTLKGKTLDSLRLNGASAENIRKFFSIYKTPSIQGILPEDRYNMDEAGIMEGYGVNGLVLGSSKKKLAIKKQPESRSWTTILECISAAGRALPPLVIFKGSSIQQQWFPAGELSFLQDWKFITSEKGWTSHEIALLWLKEIFIPCSKPDTPRRRLLIIDGHGSHETNDFLYECYINDIQLLFLPSHSSHVLQPLDLSVFSPVKSSYRRHLSNTNLLSDTAPVNKAIFLRCYHKARLSGLTKQNILAGFRASGLWPINVNKPLKNRLADISTETPQKTQKTPEKEAHESFKTPQRSQQLRELVATAAQAGKFDPTIRLLFRKIGKTLDSLNTTNTYQQMKISSLEQKLEETRPRKRQKVTTSPNSRFTTIKDVVETRKKWQSIWDEDFKAREGQAVEFESLCHEWQLD